MVIEIPASYCMDDLPPRAPVTMTHNWPAMAASSVSWVDEFLDFSAMRRSAHRRTVSDPITFVEVPVGSTEEERGFERLDDEQLRNMFAEEEVAAPSTPSDQNSENEGENGALVQPKNEHGEAEMEAPLRSKSPENVSSQIIVDPKRIKRILANRQSAQRSRVRKLQYISELERSVNTLQTEVSALSPRVAFLDHQRLLLNMDNSALKQRIAALAQDKIFKDAHEEALKKEIERLTKLYQDQQNKKKNDGAGEPANETHCTED